MEQRKALERIFQCLLHIRTSLSSKCFLSAANNRPIIKVFIEVTKKDNCLKRKIEIENKLNLKKETHRRKIPSDLPSMGFSSLRFFFLLHRAFHTEKLAVQINAFQKAVSAINVFAAISA
jgi:hypothetical protein